MLLSNVVRTNWHRAHQKRYIGLGYKYTGDGKPFHVRVEDLTPNSHVRVFYKCPSCGKVGWASYANYNNRLSDECANCRERKKLVDARGQRFGRLLIIGRPAKRGRKWICVCDCGNITHVEYRSLKIGYTFSCGCLQSEVVSVLASARRGEKHHRWKPLRDLVRNSRVENKRRRWAKDVLERDHSRCCVCGKSDSLAAHHLFQFANFEAQRWLVKNGICLCSTHHKLFHKIYGRDETTAEEFLLFLRSIPEDERYVKGDAA